MDLAAFNALPDDKAERALLACCESRAWARAVRSGRPYADRTALLDAAQRAVDGLAEEDVDEALVGHPRIGERSTAGASRGEQAGVDTEDAELARALAEGNRAYEERFGHVYLVCASGRSGRELLAVLQGRLRNDPATERVVVRRELAKINALRLEGMVHQ
ncbi:MAG: 2-oxo-4-hydroxy-4-carboxy-5-ureidoimidazoline decarboxylase [Streptosporangiales bacterium]